MFFPDNKQLSSTFLKCFPYLLSLICTDTLCQNKNGPENSSYQILLFAFILNSGIIEKNHTEDHRDIMMWSMSEQSHFDPTST